MRKPFSIVFFVLALLPNLWAMAKTPPLPKEAQATPESSAFISLTLEDCYELALKHSDELAIKKEEIARTLAAFLEASGEVIGNFDFELTRLRQDPLDGSGGSGSVGSSLSDPDKRERKWVVSQPLFQGFRSIGAVSGAGRLRKQRRGEWERGKQILFVEVVDSFYNYLGVQKDVEIIQGILSSSEERVAELKGWLDIGRSRPSEVATAESRHEVFHSELARSKGALAQSRNLLVFLIGIEVDPEHLYEEDLPAPRPEDVNFEWLVNARPDVEASFQAVKTARGNLMVAQSDLWPEFSLDSNIYEKREGFQSGISWDALFTFRVPLGKGGETLGKIKDAHSKWKEAKLTYSLAKRTAEREIKDAFAAWESAFARYQSLERAVKSAQNNYTLQEDEYERRLVTNLDVLEALQLLFETKRDANAAFYEMKKNYWRLEAAKGNCCG